MPLAARPVRPQYLSISIKSSALESMSILRKNPYSPILGKFPYHVKGNSINEKKLILGSIPQMEITREYQLKKIAEGIKFLQTNPHALEKRAGVPIGTIKDLRRGKRSMNSAKWHKICEILNSGKIEALPEPQVMRDSENAVADVIGGILYILASREIIASDLIHEFLSYLSNQYAKWNSSDDLKMIGLVRDALDGKKDLPPSHMLQKILSRPPLGSA